mmetsp:Transcript_13436/g.48883  ORF Transcript_13436/g.48883 Transcript_13436/m.48883 type:complete len:176 (-) Transcript_13436:139-666(-)
MAGREEQFVLRAPPHIAAELRAALREEGPQGAVELDFDAQLKNPSEAQAAQTLPAGHSGVFRINKKEYPVHLLDLPTHVESFKTYDDRHLVKTADVSQMLLVQDPEEDPPPVLEARDGLTPPMRNIRRKRFRKKGQDVNTEFIARIQDDIVSLLNGAGMHNVQVDVVEEEIEEDA